jgi:hypothetical protein
MQLLKIHNKTFYANSIEVQYIISNFYNNNNIYDVGNKSSDILVDIIINNKSERDSIYSLKLLTFKFDLETDWFIANSCFILKIDEWYSNNNQFIRLNIISDNIIKHSIKDRRDKILSDILIK